MHKSYLLLAMKWIGLIWIGIVGITYAEENSYGPVKSGEMLWKIAGKIRPNPSVTREQVVMSLLKTNPLAFSAPCNFNSLKVGSKLRIPPLSDMQIFDAQDAKTQVNQQSKAWKNRSKKPIECSSPETSLTPASTEKTLTPSNTEKEDAHANKASSPETPEKGSSPVQLANQATKKEELPPSSVPQHATEDNPSSPKISTEENPTPSKIPLPPVTTTSLSTPAAPPQADSPSSPPPSVSPEKPIALVADNEENPKKEAHSLTPSPPAPKVEEENPPKGQQPFMLIILAGGGLLATFIIGWLLRKHIKTCADDTVDSNASSTETHDQMPLRTDKKGPQTT